MYFLSLLFCKSATERQAELKSWLYVALAAVVFVIIGAGAELVVLEIAFAVALCLRYRAAMAARVIRRCVNEARAIGVMEKIEGREIQHRFAGIDHVTTVTSRRCSLESLQGYFASLGLSHLCLSSRLLPQPVSIARQ